MQRPVFPEVTKSLTEVKAQRNKMAAHASRVLVFLAFTTLHGAVSGLKCYSCADLDIKSGDSSLMSLLGLLGLKRDYSCEDNPASEFVDCDYFSQSCGYFSGSVTFDVPIPFVGPISTHIVSRQCLPKASHGCHTDSKTAKDAIKLFSFLGSVLSGGSIDSVNARVCTCHFDRCDANIKFSSLKCHSGFMVNNLCFDWWIIGAAAGGLVLLISFIICICCCCNSSHRHRGAVHPPAVTHTTVMMTSQPTAQPANMAAGPSYQGAPGVVQPPPYPDPYSKPSTGTEKY